MEARARTIATFRFVEVRLMEIVAAWTPITPEMEVKILFGKHIWDFAQHADALGKRTFELRLPEQHSLQPHGEYSALLEGMERIDGAAARVAALYDAFLPGLAARYRSYVEETDSLLDAPSVVIIERILRDIDRMRTEASDVRHEIGLSNVEVIELVSRERSIARMVNA